MGADGHMGGGRYFMTPLNLALVNPLSSPHVNMKGCHVSWDGDLQGLRNGQTEGLLYMCAPLSHRHQGFLTSTFRFLGVLWTQVQWQPANIS